MITPKQIPKFSRRMTYLEVYTGEILLASWSVWACVSLLTPPSNFAEAPELYSLAASVLRSEEAWATLSGLAAAAMISGLILTSLRRSRELALALRCLGLGLSGFFWTIMSVSFLLARPDALFGLPGMTMAITAWWTLLRFPRFPGET